MCGYSACVHMVTCAAKTKWSVLDFTIPTTA